MSNRESTPHSEFRTRRCVSDLNEFPEGVSEIWEFGNWRDPRNQNPCTSWGGGPMARRRTGGAGFAPLPVLAHGVLIDCRSDKQPVAVGSDAPALTVRRDYPSSQTHPQRPDNQGGQPCTHEKRCLATFGQLRQNRLCLEMLHTASERQLAYLDIPHVTAIVTRMEVVLRLFVTLHCPPTKAL